MKHDRNLHEELSNQGKLAHYAAKIARRINVSSDGCWLYIGHLCNGVASISGNRGGAGERKSFQVSVRRLMLMTAFGMDMDRKWVGPSTCGHPKCVRLLHWRTRDMKGNRLMVEYLAEADARWSSILKAMDGRETAKDAEWMVKTTFGDGMVNEIRKETSIEAA